MKHTLQCSLLLVIVCLYLVESSFIRREKRADDDSGFCEQTFCTRLGGECGRTIDTDVVEVDIDCYAGLDCGDGKCVPAPQLNASCADTYGCADGLFCDTFSQNATCVDYYPYFLRAGDPCTSDSQCSFRNGTSPFEEYIHKCDNGYCFFIPDGGDCDDNDQCKDSTSQCSSGICALQKKEGESCVAEYDQCQNLLSCTPLNTTTSEGTCQFRRLLAPGKPCSETANCPENTFCKEPANEEEYGVCTSYGNSNTWDKPCTHDSNCTQSNGERCTCSDTDTTRALKCYGHNVYPAGVYKADIDLQLCFLSHPECEVASFNETCGIFACLKQACDYYSKIPESQNCYYDMLLPLCNFQPTTSPSSSTSSSSSTSASPDQSSSASTLYSFFGLITFINMFNL